MNKAEIMKEFKFSQHSILNADLTDETKFILTKRLVINTELKLKELKENENS
jgi:hypothetical protein